MPRQWATGQKSNGIPAPGEFCFSLFLPGFRVGFLLLFYWQWQPLVLIVGFCRADCRIGEPDHCNQADRETENREEHKQGRGEEPGAVEPENNQQHRAVLDVVLPDPGVGLVAGPDGAGNGPQGKGEEGEDSFPRAEVFDQVQGNAKKDPGKKYNGRMGNKRISYDICRDKEKCRCACKNKECSREGMDQPLVTGILYRVMRMRIDPAEERSANPAGELHDQPRDGTEFEVLWPGHVDIRQQDADAGAGRDKEHQAGI